MIDHNKHIYKNFEIYLLIKNKEELYEKVLKSHKSSKYVSKYMNFENLINLNDLEKAFFNMKIYFEKEPNFINNVDINKKILIPKFHQKLFVNKILKQKNIGNKMFLLGCKPRSGKTYIVGSLISDDKNNYNNKFNILIITPAPNETSNQFMELFEDFIDFNDFNVINLKSGSEIDILNFKDNNKNFLEMLNIIKDNNNLLEIFNSQKFLWWNKSNIIDFIRYLVKKYIKENSDIYNSTIIIKMTLQSLIDNPKKLLEFINQCLKPKKVEKRNYGEVFTPWDFIMKMLEHLPKEVWTNKNLKWFDPASGMGNFTIAIYYKLMDGLEKEIPDKLERKKHILENMLYMSEYSKKNCIIAKEIFDINNEYNLNLYIGDTLTLDTKKLWNSDYFDIIIGNPPYNKEFNKGGSTPYYNEFIEKFIDKCRILYFVIPSRWFTGGKNLTDFRKMILDRNDIVLIRHFDDSVKIFGPNVKIAGGVQYIMKDSEYKGLCDFNGEPTKLNQFEIFLENKNTKIVEYISKFENIDKYYVGRCYGIETSDKRLTEQTTPNSIQCYVSQKNGFIKYIDKKHVDKDYDYWKVITARANGRKGSGFGNIFVGNKTQVHTGSYISFKCESEQEALSFESYLKCRLPNFFLSLRKSSQDISKNTCKWIPKPTFDRIWTDEEVYKFFKLTPEQINLIEKTNIVGYKNKSDKNNISSSQTKTKTISEKKI